MQDDGGRPFCAGNDGIEFGGKAIGIELSALATLTQIAGGELDEVEWLIEFVCDACDHAAETGHLVSLDELFCRAAAIGDVEHEPDGFRVSVHWIGLERERVIDPDIVSLLVAQPVLMADGMAWSEGVEGVAAVAIIVGMHGGAPPGGPDCFGLAVSQQALDRIAHIVERRMRAAYGVQRIDYHGGIAGNAAQAALVADQRAAFFRHGRTYGRKIDGQLTQLANDQVIDRCPIGTTHGKICCGLGQAAQGPFEPLGQK